MTVARHSEYGMCAVTTGHDSLHITFSRFASSRRFERQGKTQTMGVYAVGIPGIAVISQTTQAADNKGEDTNVPVQVNPVTTKP